MSDVRSLEEVIAAVLLDKADFDGFELTAQLFANEIAAAVREWLLSAATIERAMEPVNRYMCQIYDNEMRAAFVAVIGDTP